jgi:hypothetical protein
MVSGRLNVVKGLKRTNQIVRFGRSCHLIGLSIIPVRICLARDNSRLSACSIRDLRDLRELNRFVVQNATLSSDWVICVSYE